MKRNTLNFVIDLVSGLVMLGMIGTGLVIRFVLPPGSGRSRILWALGRHEWGGVHFWLAVAAGALLLLHVALHWQWVCVTLVRIVRPRGEAQGASTSRMARNAAGAVTVVLLVGVFAAFVWIARGQVRVLSGSTEGSAEHGGPGREDGADAAQGDSEIRGSMTLNETASALGISVEELRQRMRVPSDVPNDERLGRLSRRLGQPVSELRKLAEAK